MLGLEDVFFFRNPLIRKAANFLGVVQIEPHKNGIVMFQGSVDFLGSALIDHDKPVRMLTGDLEGGIVAKIDIASHDYG